MRKCLSRAGKGVLSGEKSISVVFLLRHCSGRALRYGKPYGDAPDYMVAICLRRRPLSLALCGCRVCETQKCIEKPYVAACDCIAGLHCLGCPDRMAGMVCGFCISSGDTGCFTGNVYYSKGKTAGNRGVFDLFYYGGGDRPYSDDIVYMRGASCDGSLGFMFRAVLFNPCPAPYFPV